MLVSPSITTPDKIQKIVEMADKKWKIQLKAPELAGRVEGKAPAAAPVPQAAVARALPASAAAAPAPTPVASDPLSVLTEVQGLARSVGFTEAEIALYIREVRIGDTLFCLVSGNHDDPRAQRLEDTLEQRAIKKEIVNLQEGLFRNRHAEQMLARIKHATDNSGYLYGLENEANHAFFTAWAMLIEVSDPRSGFEQQQQTFLKALFGNSTLQKHVQKLAISGCTTAKELLMRLRSATTKSGFDDFHASISVFKDPNRWFAFVCRLADIALARGHSESMQAAVKAFIQATTQYREVITGSISGRVSLTTSSWTENSRILEKLTAESRAYRDPEYADLLWKIRSALPNKGKVVLLGLNHVEGMLAHLRKLGAASKTEEKKT